MPFFFDDSPTFRFIELASTESTNSFLAHLQLPDTVKMAVTTAEFQWAGRGQTGNSWESESGKNLLFSILLHPNSLDVTQLFALSEAIAISLRTTIANLLKDEGLATYSQVCVKWPNDIYVGDKKIAGILIENELRGTRINKAIIGVGLNVNQAEFLSDAPNPVSLLQLTGQHHERRPLLETVMTHFCRHYSNIEQGLNALTHAEYQQYLYRSAPGSIWPFCDRCGTFQAHIEGVTPEGILMLKDTNGRERRYTFKEVAFIHQTPALPEPPTSLHPV